MYVLLEYIVPGASSIRVALNPNKFPYLNTFVIQLAHRCLDNGGPTVQQTHTYSIATTQMYILFSTKNFAEGPSGTDEILYK